MRAWTHGTAILAITAGGAMAGGIDRSGQNIAILFEQGRVAELTFGHVAPTIGGTDVLGNAIGDVAEDFTQISFGYKHDIDDRLSFALIVDEPFAADILYPGDPATTVFGGTRVHARSTAATGILRYRFDGGFSVHGGVKAQQASAEIDLGGIAYRGISGYAVRLEGDMAPGYLVGFAYERPDIALRIALTYHSRITHDFETTETLNGVPLAAPSTTDVDLPHSLNLDFQSGIAEGTLVFGQIRWAEWSALKLEPVAFTTATGGVGLIALEDTATFTLGIGRRFSETWSGTVSASFEDGGDPLVSPLAPTNGRSGLAIGLIHTRDGLRIAGGIDYTWIGDASPEIGTSGTAGARMQGNSSVGVGLRVAYAF